MLEARTDAATGGAAVTPSDTIDIGRTTASLYVGTGGDVAVVHEDGSIVTYPSVPSGFVLPVHATRVNATNTTASGIVAMFHG